MATLGLRQRQLHPEPRPCPELSRKVTSENPIEWYRSTENSHRKISVSPLYENHVLPEPLSSYLLELEPFLADADMSTDSPVSATSETNSYISTVKLFPPIVDGRIDIEEYLEAATDLVNVIERIGKVFTPVKYDMLGNIEKIRKSYEMKKDTISGLLQLVESEINAGEQLATEGILWLNRAMLFIELVFQQVVGCVHTNTHTTASMKKIFIVAYEGSVKRYHNWVSQQLFTLISRMCPSLPQILKSFNVTDLKAFEMDLQTLNVTLHLVRSKIDDFYKDHNLC